MENTDSRPLKSVFEIICKKNDEIILSGKEPQAMLFFNNTVSPLIFKNGNEKEAIRKVILNILLKKGVKEYILIFDCKITMVEKDFTNLSVKDACLRMYYSPNKKMTNIAIYEGNKIIQKDAKEGRGENEKDNWDLWGESIGDDINEKYQKYKKENPEKYKGCG